MISKNSSFDKLSEKRWGDAAEEAVGRYYVRQKWYWNPTAKIEMGGAPRLIGELRSLVQPDAQRSKNGVTRWVEIKFKSVPVEFPLGSRRYRHGVDRPNWHAYRAVEEATGLPGDLAIVEYKRNKDSSPSPVLLCQSFEFLHHNVSQEIIPGKHAEYPRGIVLWDRNSFDEIGPIPLSLPQDLPALPQHLGEVWKQPTGEDGEFPRLPFIDDRMWSKMSYKDKLRRHCLEIFECREIFDERQRDGIGIFDAATDLPTPRMNKRK